MAVEFKQEGDVLRITQTRAGWRWTAVVFGVFWAVGAVMAVVQSLHETPTSLDCDHAGGRCTLTEGRRVSERPITSLVRASVEVDDDAASVLLESREPPRFRWICGAAPDPAAVAAVRGLAAEIEAFRADPSHPPLALRCAGREVHGAKLHIVLPASLLGWLLVLLLTLRFSEELRVVLDRRAGTLDVAGRRWFRAPWHVQRPLADVAGIELRSRPAMRGQSYFSVHAVLTDGSDVRLWSPAAVRMSTLTERVAALRAFLGPPPP